VLVVLIGAAALATPCEQVLDVAPRRQVGKRCLVAATQTALSARGEHPDGAALSKQVAMGPEGEDTFDLQEALRPAGWDTLVFTGAPEDAARLIEAGFSPVLLLDEPAGPHAVAVVGVRRVQAPDGRCIGPVADLAMVDPRTAETTWLPAADVARRQWRERMLVSFEPTAWAALDDAGFPLATKTAQDRRFRARMLLDRAALAETSAGDRVELIRRASVTDPAWEEPRRLLAEVDAP
jgi:hypothetical protein